MNTFTACPKADAAPDLTQVPADGLRREVVEFRAYLHTLGGRAPAALHAELDEVERRLG